MIIDNISSFMYSKLLVIILIGAGVYFTIRTSFPQVRLFHSACKAVMEKRPCPDCEQEIDYEIGPDESLEDVLDTAELLQKIEGEEEVEKMDALLSLAITGGDCNWI